MRPQRVLLLVPAVTYRAGDFLAAAGRMGLDVVVGSDGALPIGDAEVVRVDPADPERAADRLASCAGVLDAVVAVDTAMLLAAAALAARLGIPGNSVHAVGAAMDKARQRCRWAAAGIPQPAFGIVPPGASVGRAAAAIGFPCVVKPVSLSGSRGVLRADDEAGAAEAARTIRGILADAARPDHEPLLVEEYVPGREVSVDGLLGDGALTVTAVFDKPDTPDGPTFEETLLLTPPDLSDRALAAVTSTASSAAQGLGLRWGPIHAELRMRPRIGGEEPAMLELAARSIGGLCSRALGYQGGASLEELVLANALGRPVTPPRLSRPAGVLMVHPELGGVLRAVDGAAAAAVPGVTGVSMTVPIGQRVRPLPEGDRYLGFVFAAAETRDDVLAALRTARRRLAVVIDQTASATG
jgi:biotin carboxylase